MPCGIRIVGVRILTGAELGPEDGRTLFGLQISALHRRASAIPYRPQYERMRSSRSGCTASFVLTWMAKRCRPPIPSCMVNSVEISVSCPGVKVVEPTTTSEGQQPSIASTWRFTAKRRG